jgi:hypothetical protein
MPSALRRWADRRDLDNATTGCRIKLGLPGTTACCEDGQVTWEQDCGWAFIGVGALLGAVNSFSLLASLHPERAAQRGGPGYHKRTARAGSSVARSELRSRLSWNLYVVALGLTLVTDYAVWSEVVLYAAVTAVAAVRLAAWGRRRRQRRSTSGA